MKITRRQAIQAASATATVSAINPRMVFAAGDETEKFRIAAVGIGGQGNSDLNSLKSHPKFELTAISDVDKSFYGVADKLGTDVKKFQDYRKMFDEQADNFDGVLVATPDHMHAPIALTALYHNKHVYLQKPLCQDIGECRLIAEVAAKKPELATQMGIQIHGHAAYRTAVSWIKSGLIGTIDEVHSWSDKGWGGEFKPTDPSPVPENLNWDLYCGVAEDRPFVKDWYHRGNWRKWIAFGTGTQGDMGCHIVDPVFTALELKEPQQVTSLGPKPFKENFALNSKIQYTFKGTKYTTPVVAMTWYNGSLRPTELSGLPEGVGLPGQGSVFVGDNGSLILPHIGNPVVYTADGRPWDKDKLPEAVGGISHYHQWIDAATGASDSTGASFDYAGPMTEAVLMGTVINRWPEQKFEWDASLCRFKGDGEMVKQANALISPPYRKGWDVPFVG